VLQSLFLVPLPLIGKLEVIGVDDWSYRRGKRYGSIIVDLKSHKIVDLLPDREAESVKAWLSAHPDVDIVSRDRGATYVDGATQGAPLATQVCDRWHLCKNLGDASKPFSFAPVPDYQNRSLLKHPNQRRSRLLRPSRLLDGARK